MEKTIPTVGVLVYNEDQVLLVKHGEKADHLNDVYGLPAGRLMDGESELETAVRELNEETGLITTVDDLVELPKTYSALIRRKDGEKKFSLKVFLCRKYDGNIQGNDETIPEWVNISGLTKLDLLPNTYDAVQQGLAYR